jgi:hypothetical protein
MRALTSIISLALATSATLAAAQIPARQTDASFTWTGRVASGATLRMRNIAGQINVERSTSGQVEVTGLKEWRRGDPADVRFEVTPEGADVVICAIWFEGACASNDRGSTSRRDDNRDVSRNNDVSVVFTVKLPSGVNIDARGVSAGVSVVGARGIVQAASVSGNVIVTEVSGTVNATSVSGNVEVEGTTLSGVTATSVSGNVAVNVDALTGSSPLTFNSVSGNVEATFPAALDADVSMTTVSGRVNSDFPFASTAGRTFSRNLNGRIGSGGRGLTFSTVSGDITLRRR